MLPCLCVVYQILHIPMLICCMAIYAFPEKKKSSETHTCNANPQNDASSRQVKTFSNSAFTDSLMLPVLPNGGQHQGKNIFVDFRWRWKIQIHSSELQIKNMCKIHNTYIYIYIYIIMRIYICMYVCMYVYVNVSVYVYVYVYVYVCIYVCMYVCIYNLSNFPSFWSSH